MAKDSTMPKASALAKLGESFWDPSLGLGYRHALEITLDILNTRPDEEQNKALELLYSVFVKWRDEHGIYPPSSGGLLGTPTEKQQPAKEYIESGCLVAALSKEDFTIPAPWHCANGVSTPIGLFKKLLVDSYPPLMEIMKTPKRYTTYEYLLAIAIVISNSDNQPYLRGQIVEAALELAKIKMDSQKHLIKEMDPLARETFMKRHNAKQARRAQKEEKARIIISLYEAHLSEGTRPPLKVLKHELQQEHGEKGFSESTICNYLREAGYPAYGK